MSARDERDKGIDRVLRREFQQRYIAWVESHIQPGWEGTGADIRLRMEIGGAFIPPHHHNAWGANFGTLIGYKWFADTGRTENNIARASHARRNPVWRKTHEYRRGKQK